MSVGCRMSTGVTVKEKKKKKQRSVVLVVVVASWSVPLQYLNLTHASFWSLLQLELTPRSPDPLLRSRSRALPALTRRTCPPLPRSMLVAL